MYTVGLVSVIFHVVSSSSGSQDFTVTLSPPSVIAVQGTNQTFHCTFSVPETAYFVKVAWMKQNSGTDTVLWIADGNTHTHKTTHNQADLNFPNFPIRLSGLPATGFPAFQTGHFLTFFSVQLGDTGEYYCRATYWEDPHTYTSNDSSTTTMNVQGESIKHTYDHVTTLSNRYDS